MSLLFPFVSYPAEAGGATPTVVGDSSNYSASRVSSLAVTIPAGAVAGDLMIISAGSTDANRDINNPSGWTLLEQEADVSVDGGRILSYKVLDSSDISAGSITVTATDPIFFRIAAIVLNGAGAPVVRASKFADEAFSGTIAAGDDLTAGSLAVLMFVTGRTNVSGSVSLTSNSWVVVENTNNVLIGHQDVDTASNLGSTSYSTGTRFNYNWIHYLEVPPA